MERFDYFALRPKFFIDKKQSHPTAAGVFMTFSIFTFILIFFASLLDNFINKKSPIINITEKNFKDIPIFEININQFSMGFFFLTNQGNYMMDPTIFKIQAFISKIYLGDNNTVIDETSPLELEPCTEDHFPKDEKIRKTFPNLGVLKSLCFKKHQKQNPRLVGVWGQEKFERILVKYVRCVNSSSR